MTEVSQTHKGRQESESQTTGHGGSWEVENRARGGMAKPEVMSEAGERYTTDPGFRIRGVNEPERQ